MKIFLEVNRKDFNRVCPPFIPMEDVNVCDFKQDIFQLICRAEKVTFVDGKKNRVLKER